ncbi:MAG: CHAD domain-containing protein [Thiobacillus sp.]|nr:CHAD domain-containing protein [Thiobacillus sp.]
MTPPDPVEIELKTALPSHQVAMFLKLMARRRCVPVQHDLVTRYFDTPDFALSAQGIAFRVRKQGRRWLQTLKTEGERQGGLSQRAEYEVVITRGTPDWKRFPAEALALVPEALRTQLVPVFETQFHRTAWLLKGQRGVQIEVALDVGEVRAGKRSQPICEIELELKAGQPDALFVLAQGWAQQLDCVPLDISKAERGVRLAHGQAEEPVKSASVALNRDMSVEDGFAAMVQVCLAQFQANLPGVRASDDIEYVHQARVALRRLRAALRLYRRLCVLPDELMDGLRTLVSALGPARDWDVLCTETLPAIAPHYPDANAWQHGFSALASRRAELRATTQAALMQAHPGAWLLAFQRWMLQRGWRTSSETQRLVQLSPLKKWARRALQKGHRPIVRGARDFGRLQPVQRHALRIAIKRQRYATEFFQSLFTKRLQARYQAVLQELQDSLGRINDASVAKRLLMDDEVDTGPMGPFVLGWLAAQQANEAKGEIEKQLKSFMKWVPSW